MSPTLGAQLSAHLRQRPALSSDAEARYADELEAVETFYDLLKEAITSDIQAARKMRPLHLGGPACLYRPAEYALRTWQLTTTVRPIAALDRSDKAFAPQWRSFLQWAQQNELQVSLANEHDGGGMHSWIAIKVAPLSHPSNPANGD